jgi:hypothetical protein
MESEFVVNSFRTNVTFVRSMLQIRDISLSKRKGHRTTKALNNI